MCVLCVCVFTCRLFCCCLPVGAYHSKGRGVEKRGDWRQGAERENNFTNGLRQQRQRPPAGSLFLAPGCVGYGGVGRKSSSSSPSSTLLLINDKGSLSLSLSFLPPCPCVSLLVGVCLRVRSEGECQLLASQEGVSGRASEREQIRRSFPVAPLWAGPRPTTGAKKRHAVFQQK